MCPPRRPAGARAAAARGRLGGVRGHSEVVSEKVAGPQRPIPKQGKAAPGPFALLPPWVPPREPGWDLQAFPGMMPVRTPSPGASLEPFLVLPAACLKVSRLSQPHPRELSVGRPPSDPAGPGTVGRSHFHNQLPGIRLRWRKETGESPPACPDSVGRRGRGEGKLES